MDLEPVVLWQTATARCTCSYGPNDEIEVVLTVRGVEVERVVFTDANEAADWAIAQMHAYTTH